MSPFDGDICKVVYLRIFVVLFHVLTPKMIITTGISHYQLYTVICQWGGSDGCFVSLMKNHTQQIQTLYFIIDKGTRIFINQASDFSKSFSLFFSPFFDLRGGCFSHFVLFGHVWVNCTTILTKTVQYWKSLRVQLFYITHNIFMWRVLNLVYMHKFDCNLQTVKRNFFVFHISHSMQIFSIKNISLTTTTLFFRLQFLLF